MRLFDLFMQEHVWALPLFIFCARICDVTFGTLRMRFVSRGYRLAAAAVGFLEVLIWVAAIRELILSMDRWSGYLAYAGGYAVGTYLGLLLEKHLALGKVMVRAFPNREPMRLLEMLHNESFATTTVDADGTRGKVKIIHAVVPRSAVDGLVAILKQFDAQMFFTVEEVGTVHQGIYPTQSAARGGAFRMPRIGK